jgi:hypothetical protein
MDHTSKTTIDHDEIRRWAEARGARPSSVKGTGEGDDPGILRLDFPGGEEEAFEEISWDEFFEKFEDNQLALVYQEQKADGEPSFFSKLVRREGAQKSKSKGSKGKKSRAA